MRIVHTIHGIWTHTGGPAESVPQLCAALAERGHSVSLMTLDGPLSATTLKSRERGVDVRAFPRRRFPFGLDYSAAFSRSVRSEIARCDIVHGHGVWSHINWATGRWALNWRKPLVISPRGSLEPPHLEHGRWKKRVVSALFDNRFLRRAACIHAASETEYCSVREYGLQNPIAIVPNGVDLSLFDLKPDTEFLFGTFPELQGKKIALFLSRLSWEKGLHHLAQAWRRIAPDFPDWRLLVVGGGRPKYERELRRIYEEARIADRVVWTGPLFAERKLAAFTAADLFVLPSLGENFGLAVAEAMAAGLPVITTHETPWSVLSEQDLGWWVPVGDEPLSAALREALSMDDDARSDMGRRGSALVRRRFKWDVIGRDMETVYRWILESGPLPQSVRLD